MAKKEEASYRHSHGAANADDWELIERYAADFVTDDFRLVFRRGAQILEIGITHDQFKAFEKPAAMLVRPNGEKS